MEFDNHINIKEACDLNMDIMHHHSEQAGRTVFYFFYLLEPRARKLKTLPSWKSSFLQWRNSENLERDEGSPNAEADGWKKWRWLILPPRNKQRS